jgi:hydroxymethylpyrimidine/phosphomethylpyrimidine kinase
MRLEAPAIGVTPAVALTIAGSDSSAGAGIQADLKTFAAHRVYGTCAITAVTAQDTHGVRAVQILPPAVVGAQLAAVLGDLRVAATKVGMVPSRGIADAIALRAAAGELPNLVVDPVLASSSGTLLGRSAAVERLLTHAAVVTPNLDEVSALVGWRATTPAEVVRAAGELGSNGPSCVVVTGGDLGPEPDTITPEDADPGEGFGVDGVDALPAGTSGRRVTVSGWPDVASPDLVSPRAAVDVVWTADEVLFLCAPRVATLNTHGTGCTFSAAVAARLALGDPLPYALVQAKEYVSRALAGAAGWRLGGGHGPLDHLGFG